MEISARKKLQQYLTRRGIRYLKSYPHARYEDVREKLMDINYKGTAKDHPSFAFGCLTDEHLKWIAGKVRQHNPHKLPKAKAKKKTITAEFDLKTYAIQLVKEKFGKDFHSLSQMFPYMNSDELAMLRDNVDKNRPDVVKVYMLGGKVLEGKNMMLVAAVLGLKVEFVEYEGDDPIGFVLTRNLHRRHLTTPQRAYVAAQMVTTTLGSNQYKGTGIPVPSLTEVTLPEAAMRLQVSPDSVSGAKKVLDSGNKEVIEELRDGKISVNAAVRKVGSISNFNDLSDPPVLDEKKAAKVIKRYVDDTYIEQIIDLMKAEGVTDTKTLLGNALVAYLEAHAVR